MQIYIRKNYDKIIVKVDCLYQRYRIRRDKRPGRSRNWNKEARITGNRRKVWLEIYNLSYI